MDNLFLAVVIAAAAAAFGDWVMDNDKKWVRSIGASLILGGLVWAFLVANPYGFIMNLLVFEGLVCTSSTSMILTDSIIYRNQPLVWYN
jgi:hypothetical protein